MPPKRKTAGTSPRSSSTAQPDDEGFKAPGTPASAKRRRSNPPASSSSSSSKHHSKPSSSVPAGTATSSCAAEPTVFVPSSFTPSVPTTASSSTSASARAKKPRKPSSNKRDLKGELQKAYSTAEAILEATKALDINHLRPLAESTLEKQEIVRRLWVSYFDTIPDADGNLDNGEATLEQGSKFPPLEQVKHTVQFAATKGKSGLGFAGVTGWSYHTTQKFFGRALGMVSRLSFSMAFRY